MANYQPVRGTQDYLPREARLREYVKQSILESYSEFGFLQINTPMLENIELLSGGDSGDNQKLMFKILKRGEKLELDNINTENDLVDMALRYDLTVPLARFYANNSEKLPNPFKAIQIAEVFRAERPQKGRLRQFVQCDIDVLGDSSNNAEIECLMVSANALIKLGFTQFEYRISDRRILNSLIAQNGYAEHEIASVCISLDKLDKVGIEGVKNELLEKNLSGNAITLLSAIQQVQEQGIDALSDLQVNPDAIANVKQIIESVNTLAKNKPFQAVFDISIIRGQGYYTSSVFEVYANGFAGACGGGGRYDTMIEKICGKPSPAIGFSLGFERLCIILNDNNFVPPQKEMLALVYNKEDNFVKVYEHAQTLSKNYVASAVPKAKNLSNQLLKLKDAGFAKWQLFGDIEIKEIK